MLFTKPADRLKSCLHCLERNMPDHTVPVTLQALFKKSLSFEFGNTSLMIL